VVSSPEEGSTFWFTVPLEDACEGSERVPIRPDDQPSKSFLPLAGRVLLVEDDEGNRMMAKEMLADWGVDCLEAKNGEEALLALASAGKLDLILMDCQMPVMDGYEAARHIRAWEGSAELLGGGPLPIIAMTANDTDEDRGRCLEAGMDDFLPKPFKMAELHEILGTWLPKRLVVGLREA